jgi:hypothetical protein
MRAQFAALVVLSASTLTAVSAQGVIVNLAAEADNTLYQDPFGTPSNGAGGGMFVGLTTSNTLRRGLIRFDTSSIPAGSTILSATLRLHMSRTVSGDQVVEVRRALASWGEGTSVAPGEGGNGGAPSANDATWLHRFFAGPAWTNQGGDFASGRSDSATVGGIGFYEWANLGSDVQAWVNSPASNFGWGLLGNEGSLGSAKRFDTRENVAPEFRPVLVVEFVPAPGSAAGLLLGLAALRRNRARG